MPAETEIRRRIAERGAINFAEFMELALYHPSGGYYTSGERVGAGGDFYTSPAVHPAFGSLLAVQLFQMWELLGHPEPFTVAEPGAGNGLLCRDIIGAASGLPEGFEQAIRYVSIDRRTLPGLEQGLRSVGRVASERVPLSGVVGCVLSNELLDAMPVHQVMVQGGQLREVYVALNGESLVTQTGEPSTPLLGQRLESLGMELAEGQLAEINLGLESWMADVSQSLERGFVLTIDYGRTAEDLYSPTERFRGTLTTYHNHLQIDRPLERIGRQDMSAQVDFSTAAKAGQRAGLEAIGFVTQADFLRNLGLDQLLRRSLHGPQRSAHTWRMGMRELAKPDGLGFFKVLAQGKNVGQPELWGFAGSEMAAALIESMPLPVLTPEHIDLAGGRYPAAESEFEIAWDSLWPGDDPDG